MAYHKVGVKALMGAGWLAIASIIFMVGLVSFWLLEPYKLPIINEPIRILNENKEIAVGEPIRMELVIDKQQPLQAVNQSPRIVCGSGNLVLLTGEPRELPVGTYTVTSDRYLLPPKVLSGDTCRFFFQTTFQINPIKTAQADWVSEPFTVISKGAHNE